MSIRKKSAAVKYMEKLVGENLTFGLLLKSLREGEEMTQIEFAKLLGISSQYLCDIEKGRRFISPKVAAEFAEKLGFSTKHFVRLCLQDMLDRDGLNLIINVDAA
ncbi:MAG: hypothetical protein K940chlam3_01129 [Chlamydiae bacterium]|nr:hypothetical protein [Chlamydiota bacterium]